MEKKSIKDIARALAEQALAQSEYELVDVQFKSEQGQWYLNIFIDKPGGITLDDCEIANNLIDPALDAELEIVGKHDYLTISSPGLDRPIKTDRDFQRNLGRMLDLKLFSPIDKKKEFAAMLDSFDQENAYFSHPGKEGLLAIKRANIAKAQQYIEF